MKKSEFFNAIVKSDVEAVKEALNAGVEDPGEDMHVPDDGASSLILAASVGNMEVVKLLVEAGTDINYTHATSGTPLLSAVLADNKDMVKYLLDQGADPLVFSAYIHKIIPNTFGHPFHDSVSRGPEMLDLFLKHGVDPNLPGPSEFTALMVASQFGNFESAELLLTSGADVNYSTEDGVSAMVVASYQKNMELVKLLVSKGANINATPKDGITPLMRMVKAGEPSLVKELLRMGADASIQSEDKRTALSFVDSFNPVGLEIIEILLAAGASPNFSLGKRPIITDAVANNDEKLVALLIKHGADLEVVTQHGDTPLVLAVAGASDRIVFRLLEAGADPHKPDSAGRTPSDLVKRRTVGRDRVSAILEKFISG